MARATTARPGRPTTKKPATTGGLKLQAFVLRKFGSLRAAAEAAGLPVLTLRRYVYDPPKRPMLAVVTALEAIGAKRGWLVGQAG